MNEEKINSLYITEKNRYKPIMVAVKSNSQFAIDIHVQILYVKNNRIKFDMEINDQSGKKIGKLNKTIDTQLETINGQTLFGEITSFLILDADELVGANSLHFNVTINDRATVTTVLLLKENSNG